LVKIGRQITLKVPKGRHIINVSNLIIISHLVDCYVFKLFAPTGLNLPAAGRYEKTSVSETQLGDNETNSLLLIFSSTM